MWDLYLGCVFLNVTSKGENLDKTQERDCATTPQTCCKFIIFETFVLHFCKHFLRNLRR